MTTFNQPGPKRRLRSRQWTPPQTPDHRPDSTVCGICVRSLLPRRAVRRHRLPICQACAEQPNDLVLVEWWLAVPRHKRREWIAVAFDLDPADYCETHPDAGVIGDTGDVSAGSTAEAGNNPFRTGQAILPVNTFWTIWMQRDRPAHQ
jgi:hypothetical protein